MRKCSVADAKDDEKPRSWTPDNITTVEIAFLTPLALAFHTSNFQELLRCGPADLKPGTVREGPFTLTLDPP